MWKCTTYEVMLPRFHYGVRISTVHIRTANYELYYLLNGSLKFYYDIEREHRDKNKTEETL